MHLEDLLAALDVGQAHIDAPVKAAGTQKRVIENVGTVRGRHDDDAGVVSEAVHLHEELVERLLALVVAAAETAAALTADRIDLIDEDDRGGHLFGLLEQVAHTAGADADIELHEVGAGDAQKLDARLARNGLGHEGFAGARRADEQHALGDARAHLGIVARALEEVHDLAQLLLFLVRTGDVRKRLFFVLIDRARGGLAEAADAGGSPAAAHAVHHQVPDDDENAHDDEIRQEGQPPRGLPALLVVIFLEGSGVLLLLDQLAQIVPEPRGARERLLDLILLRLGIFLAQLQRELVALERERLDLLLLEEILDLGVGIGLNRLVGRHNIEDQRDENHTDEHVEAHIAGAITVFVWFQILSHPI